MKRLPRLRARRSGRASASGGLALALALSCTFSNAASLAPAVILDDGEKIMRDARRPLPRSPWPDAEPIDLFAMRGETIALQIVLDGPIAGAHASLGSLSSDAGPLAARSLVLAEQFVRVARPSGNTREPWSSLAFTEAAAPPRDAYVGEVADALTPGNVDAASGQRAALWMDLEVPSGARAGTYTGTLSVDAAGGPVARRAVHLRVLDYDLPFDAARATVFYDSATLAKRMGPAAATAEHELRRLFHAHHLTAIHELTSADAPALDLDDDALTGAAFTRAHGYEGPGDATGEGIFAIGAYGSLGEPTPDSLAIVDAFADRLRRIGVADHTDAFVYAVDEKCKSTRPARWRALLRSPAGTGGIHVGATCDDDPPAQAADLVMVTTDAYVPARVRVAREAGKRVWVYNGRRPFAGATVLDVPAIDLRANGWIAARYGIERWFYWESAYWLDDGRGGLGGAHGWDPYEVAETFHNADGDYENGDGILVYPGTQPKGMRDYGASTLYPSIRLKNLRRGVEDAGYIALARDVDRARADEVVARMVPRALALAGTRVAWPERGATWLEARRQLVAILERGRPLAYVDARASPAGCEMSPHAPSAYIGEMEIVGTIFLIVVGLKRRRSSRLGANVGSQSAQGGVAVFTGLTRAGLQTKQPRPRRDQAGGGGSRITREAAETVGGAHAPASAPHG